MVKKKKKKKKKKMVKPEMVFNMAGTKSFYQGELVSLFAAPLSRWIINIFQYSHALLAENFSPRTSSLSILIGKSVWYTID